MAEDQSDTREGQPTPEQDKTEVTFSDAQQEKLNEIISKRLAERDAKHAEELRGIEAKHQREMELSKMDEESRHKAEEEEKTKELTKRAEAAEHMLRVATTERELAKVGLDSSLAETLMGKDDKETVANIDAVVKAAKAMADKMYAERVGSSGAPKAPSGATGSSDLRSQMRRAAGLSDVGGK